LQKELRAETGLSNNELEDALQELSALEYIRNEKITNSAITYLTALTSLRELKITETSITADGKERIGKARPDIVITEED